MSAPAPHDVSPGMTRAAPSAEPPVEYQEAVPPWPRREIRSFVRRAGRSTDAQVRARAQWGPQFIQPYRAQLLDIVHVFGRQAPTILEIGFGMGDATAHIAAHRPEHNFIGCEVHEPGIGALLKHIGEQQLHNLRVIPHDAVEVLTHMVAPASLAGVHVFFPDPWHKKRHHKRRLIQAPLVRLLASRLSPGGYVHCATDWQPYAEQMLAVLRAETSLRNTVADYAPQPAYRPSTKFERRGLRLGHGVWDLVFHKLPPAPLAPTPPKSPTRCSG